MTDFKALLEALAKEGVEFIVVGGVAAAAHGSAHATSDLDVVYKRSAENHSRLSRAMTPHDPYLRGMPRGLPFTWDASTIRNGLNFTLTTKLGDVDFLGEITGGGGYEALEPHTIAIKLYDIDLKCLDLGTLIRVKRAAGRPKDLVRLGELEALLEEKKR